MPCIFLAKATASSALHISGSETISMSGVPARFKIDTRKVAVEIAFVK